MSSIFLILILIYAILYLILAIRKLDWAVMLLIIALPSYLIRFKILGIPFTLLEAMILISFTVWVIANRRQLIANIRQLGKAKQIGEQKIKYPFRWEIVLMLIISYGAMAVAGFSSSAMGIWKAYFFEPVLVFILVLNVFKNNTPSDTEALAGKNNANDTPARKASLAIAGGRMTRINMNKIFWAFSISALAVSALAIYQKFTGAWIPNEFWAAPETRRVTSFFGYPNAVGLYLAPLVMLFIGWLAEQTRLYQQEIMKNFKLVMQIIFSLIVILASILAIYFAHSDGALIALIVALLIFGILANRKLRAVTLSIFVVICVAVFYFQIININIINKITLTDLSGQIRRVQWQETWQMLRDGRIIFGSGLANYQEEIEQYHTSGFYLKSDDPEYEKMIKISLEYQQLYWQPLEIYLYPHNIILNFWTEIGLAGMLLFVWIIVKFMGIGVKRYLGENIEDRYLVLGLICAMLAIVVHGLVDVPYFKNDLSVMFWIMITIMSLINLKFKNSMNNK